jgi:hypothetical protein
MAKVVIAVASLAANLRGLFRHKRNDRVVHNALALYAEIVDIIA